MKQGFLIDMDGVIYRGNKLIPGASDFICALQDLNLPFLFLTNNSQRTRKDVVAKLQRLGINVPEETIFTCAIATARYLASQKSEGTAFVIGEGGLLNELNLNGYAIVDSDPDFVVVGENRTFNCEMVDRAVQFILRGAKLISTNLDPSCPTSDGGTRIGCGAIVAMLEAATGRKALHIGKPSPLMMRAARKELMIDAAHTTMIGDTMETDILGGMQMGYRTVLVLSGGTKLEDLSQYAYLPDHIVASIADLKFDKGNIQISMRRTAA